jgi:hypothetical protein
VKNNEKANEIWTEITGEEGTSSKAKSHPYAVYNAQY